MLVSEIHQAAVASANRRIAELEAENAYLRRMLAPPASHFPPVWCLSRSEERLVAALLRAPADGYATHDMLHGALFTDEDVAESNAVPMAIARLRKKIARTGIEIENVWGRGYRLSEDSRVVLERALERRAGALRRQGQRARKTQAAA